MRLPVPLFLAFVAFTAGAAAPYPVVVSFGSVCCGTDAAAQARVEQAIARHEARTGRPVDRRRAHWGKEGEFNLCLLPAAGAPALVEDLRRAIEGGTATTLHLGGTCEGAPIVRRQ